MGCHFLLQGIFLTQGSNLGLPHCRQMLYCLSHQRSPQIERNESCSVMLDSLRPHVLYSPGILQARILEWVASPFSRGYSQLRDQTQVSHICLQCRRPRFNSWVSKIHWRRNRLPTQPILLGFPCGSADKESSSLSIDYLS